MLNNYSAWDIKMTDFNFINSERERIKFFLRFAILAPSSHNSQPWKFSLDDNFVDVYLEPRRRLPISDNNDRQAYISVGCAIENLVIVADHYGYHAEIDYANGLPHDKVARITFNKKLEHQSSGDQLALNITKRVNNRYPYKSIPPQKDFIGGFINFSKGPVSVFVLRGQQKDDIADVALRASIEAMESRAFRNELSDYVKSNNTKSPTGMPGFGMGIPLLVSYFTSTMVKHINMNKVTHKKDKKLLLKQTPIVCVLGTQNDDREAWLETGRCYERLSLLAINAGLSTAMWAAPIQIGKYYQEIQEKLGTSCHPQALFRLGYPTKQMAHSPRLALEEVIS